MSTDIQTLARAHAHASFLASGGVVNVSSASELESKGWRVWLTTLFPFAFAKEFSQEHCQFWNLYWSVLMRIKEIQRCQRENVPCKIKIQPNELIILYILGRGLGKSASIEPSAIMRGAILRGGYSLFISETDDQANEHLGNARILIEHPESRLIEFYPDMAITENPLQGLPSIDRRELFVTRCGWIARAKGLKAKMRGLRVGTQRPDDLNIDDIDDINDSIALSVSKLRVLTASILPVQANEFTTIKFTQNLIIEQGVMNQIHRGIADALADRVTIGPTATFKRLDYESYIDAEDGRLKHRLLQTCEPTWAGVDIEKAQRFLSGSGLIPFLAEYQNDFEKAKEGKVLKNYKDFLMVITESMFAQKFGSIKALNTFNKYVMHDWSKTKSAYHANVAGKLAVSGQETTLPGKLFLCDLMSFEEQTQADDVGLAILESICELVPGTRQTWRQLIDASLSRQGLEVYLSDATRLIEARRDILANVIPKITSDLLRQLNYVRFVGSNEQNNDALQVYRRVFGLPFQPVNPGEFGGLEWANHYMTVDKKTRHPFFEDELIDGEWKLGCPGLFIIVKDSQYAYPKSPTSDVLHGSDLWRFQFNNWLMRAAKLTEAGLIEYGPMKMHDDCGQALQMCLLGNRISAAPLTHSQKIQSLIPDKYKRETLKENYSAERELGVAYQEARARARIKPTIRQWDYLGNEIGSEDAEG